MGSSNGRTPEVVRREIQAERNELARGGRGVSGRGSARRPTSSASCGRTSPLSRPARSAPASSSPAASARRCGSWPARAATARRGQWPRRRGRPGSDTPRRAPGGSPRASGSPSSSASFRSFLDDDCMGLSQQVAFSSLLAFFPAMRLPRRPARPRRRVRGAEGLPRPRRAGRRDRHDRDAAAGHDEGHVRRSRSSIGALRRDVGGERRDERDHQGRQPRLRPGRDPAALEDADHRDRARRASPASSSPACCC